MRCCVWRNGTCSVFRFLAASCHLRPACIQTVDYTCGMTRRRSGSMSDVDKRGKYACIVTVWSAHSISWLASRPSPPACFCCHVYSIRNHDFWISCTDWRVEDTQNLWRWCPTNYLPNYNENCKYSNQNSRWQRKVIDLILIWRKKENCWSTYTDIAKLFYFYLFIYYVLYGVLSGSDCPVRRSDEHSASRNMESSNPNLI